MTDPIRRDGPTRNHTAVLVAGAVIVAAIIIANAWPKPSQAPTHSNPNPIGSPEKPITAPEDRSSGFNASFLTPGQFTELARAEKFINLNQGKNGVDLEQIVFGIVQDPTDVNAYYFATSSLGTVQAGTPHFVGVYKYEADSASWQRLYKRSYPNESGATAMLRVIGVDGDRLIVFEDTVDNSPGPCTSVYLLADNTGSLLSLSMKTPLEGLKSYEISESLAADEKAKQDECLKHL